MIWIDAWPSIVVGPQGWKRFLRSKDLVPGDGTIIILDEAQTSYWDMGLWQSLFKSICSQECNNRAIVFTSRGSPTSVPEEVTVHTTIAIPLRNKVTLRPIDHKDGTAPIGLFLTHSEFESFAEKLSRTLPLARFDKTFYDWVYNVTAGHVGAARDVIHYTASQTVCRLNVHSLHIIEVEC